MIEPGESVTKVAPSSCIFNVSNSPTERSGGWFPSKHSDSVKRWKQDVIVLIALVPLSLVVARPGPSARDTCG